jgi:hypothetical protein
MRFRQIGNVWVPVLELSLKRGEAQEHELHQLIILGDALQQPVAYRKEFDEPKHTISIEVVSAQRLREALR